MRLPLPSYHPFSNCDGAVIQIPDPNLGTESLRPTCPCPGFQISGATGCCTRFIAQSDSLSMSLTRVSLWQSRAPHQLGTTRISSQFSGPHHLSHQPHAHAPTHLMLPCAQAGYLPRSLCAPPFHLLKPPRPSGDVGFTC